MSALTDKKAELETEITALSDRKQTALSDAAARAAKIQSVINKRQVELDSVNAAIEAENNLPAEPQE